MHYCLDACALIAFLNDEEGADKIENLLNQSSVNNTTLSMSIVNLLEVYYGELRDKGEDVAQIVLDMVQHYSINVVNTVSEKVFYKAAQLKTKYKMSLADCIGLATAAELSSQFVTSDHQELEVVMKNDPSTIFWFR